jgi:hypothetical protein
MNFYEVNIGRFGIFFTKIRYFWDWESEDKTIFNYKEK